MNFSAFIPIKLYSERVPNKNFYEISGKPLFYYILSTLQSVELVDEIVIDIDHIEIKEKVNKYFNDIKFNLRKDNLSSPTESVNKIIASNIDNFKNEYIIQTHVTNPLLTSSSINQAAEQFIKNKKPLFSVNMFQSRFYNSSNKPINHDVDILLPTSTITPSDSILSGSSMSSTSESSIVSVSSESSNVSVSSESSNVSVSSSARLVSGIIVECDDK